MSVRRGYYLGRLVTAAVGIQNEISPGQLAMIIEKRYYNCAFGCHVVGVITSSGTIVEIPVSYLDVL